jgi:hypothetical protein
MLKKIFATNAVAGELEKGAAAITATGQKQSSGSMKVFILSCKSNTMSTSTSKTVLIL